MKRIVCGDEHRGKRNKKVFKAVTVGVIARGVNIVSGFITIPLTLTYLGTDLFGVWIVLTNFVAFLQFTDLGMGVGLQNSLSECYGRDDRVSPRYYVSSTYLLLTFMALSLVVMAFFVVPLLPVEKLVKVVEPESISQIMPAIQSIVIIFAIGLPAGLIQRVLNGYQKQHISNTLLICGRLLALLGVVICIYFKQPLFILTTVFLGAPYLVMFFYGAWFFYGYQWLRPNIKNIRFSCMQKVTNIGGWAVLAQIAYTIKISLPPLIISFCLGSVAVASFSVTQKLLSVAGLLVGIGLQPLWPAYGEAYFRGDKEWILATLQKSLLLVCSLCALAFISMIFLGKFIIEFWTGSIELVPTWSLLMACNVWSVLLSINITLTMVLNGTNHFKSQATKGIVTSVLACGVAFFVADRLGVAGVVWVMVICAELTLTPFFLFEIKKLLNDMTDKNTVQPV